MSGKRTSSLLIDEQPLQVIPSLAEALGVNAAILLQQINYWVKHAERANDRRKFRQGRWWTYNTYGDWQQQMPWLTESGIRKLVKQLKDRGLILVEKFGKRAQDHTLWYAIDYEAVESLRTLGHIDVSESDTSNRPAVTDLDVSESDTSYATESPESHTESSSSSTNVLESGDRSDGDDPPPAKETKAQDLKQFAVAELMKRVSSARERGSPIHDPIDRDRAQYARFFATRSKIHDVETLLFVFDYMVRKASGEMEGEPKAWCGFDTALDFVLAGWRPENPVRDEEERRRILEENARAEAELLEGVLYNEPLPEERPSPGNIRRMMQEAANDLASADRGRSW